MRSSGIIVVIAGPVVRSRRHEPDADVYEFDDEQEDADELCPIRISKLELRLPVVQEGAQLCTVSWKGEVPHTLT